MKKTNLLISLFALTISSSLFASQTSCDRSVPSVLAVYAKKGLTVTSYQTRSCTTLVRNDLSSDTGADETAACVTIFKFANKLPELLVLDSSTHLSLQRSFGNEDSDVFMAILTGNPDTGIIEFSKKEGRSTNMFGLNTYDFVTKAEYSAEDRQLTIKKWKLGSFSNTDINDYVVQCD